MSMGIYSFLLNLGGTPKELLLENVYKKGDQNFALLMARCWVNKDSLEDT